MFNKCPANVKPYPGYSTDPILPVLRERRAPVCLNWDQWRIKIPTGMTQIEPCGPVRYCLVCDDEVVETAVRICCPPPHLIETFPLDGLVSENLELSDIGREIIGCARTAEAVLISWRFDLAPMINTLCFHVRRHQSAPVIALVRGGQEDTVAAIAAGADDAMTFPLYPPLLHARTLAYRRLADAARQSIQDNEAGSTPTHPPRHDVLQFGPLRLDRTAHRFYINGEEVELTPREFTLLEYLIEHHDTLLTRDQILGKVWGINFDTGTNMVDVYMYFLRRKLEARGIKKMIQTVRGRGYRLVLPESAGR